MSTTLADLVAQLDAFRDTTLEQLNAAESLDALEAVRASSVGRTRGALNDFKSQLPKLAGADKPVFGSRFNAVKVELEAAIDARLAVLSASAPAAIAIDLSMPARRQWRGAKHPVTIVMEEIEAIFRDLGFTIATGPEAEHEWYNFGALNFPPNHPAMDMHDTLYLEARRRSSARIHRRCRSGRCRSYPPPIRIIAPGNVYRRDFFDASHAPMFAQIEGLAVDEGISFVDLKATLANFAEAFLRRDRHAASARRFFPFTEPSAEMDVPCAHL